MVRVEEHGGPARRLSGGHGRRWLAAALMAIACGGAVAHEFWLVPHEARAEPGDQVVLELRIGPNWPGVQTARLPNLFGSFVMRDALGQLPVDGRDGALAVGHLRLRVAGAAVIALRTNPASLQLPAADFEQYLKEEGLLDVLDFRRNNGLQNQPGREIFSRCAKTIILAGASSMGFDQLMHLPLELVPVDDPLRFQARRLFTVQLLRNGAPLPGALIKAQLKGEHPLELSARSDGRGMVSLALPAGGLWLFNAVHMTSTMDNAADWESTWASLTIELPQ